MVVPPHPRPFAPRLSVTAAEILSFVYSNQTFVINQIGAGGPALPHGDGRPPLLGGGRRVVGDGDPEADGSGRGLLPALRVPCSRPHHLHFRGGEHGIVYRFAHGPPVSVCRRPLKPRQEELEGHEDRP